MSAETSTTTSSLRSEVTSGAYDNWQEPKYDQQSTQQDDQHCESCQDGSETQLSMQEIRQRTDMVSTACEHVPRDKARDLMLVFARAKQNLPWEPVTRAAQMPPSTVRVVGP